MLRAIAAVVLVVFLTACSAGNTPNRAVIETAIAQQISLIQQDIGKQLYADELSLPEITVSRVTVTHRQSLTINEQRAYRIEGRYDATLSFPKRQVNQSKTDFEVYVQQLDDKTWQLARPLSEPGSDEQTWEFSSLSS